MLEVLEVTGRQYDKVFNLAKDAAKKGWWDRYGRAMGPRQRLHADLKSAAESIRNYNQTAFPTALQTPDFINALVSLDEDQGPLPYQPNRMIEARLRRQERLLQPEGPTYDAVLDECMIHRLAIPPEIKAAQLQHLIQVVDQQPSITVRVLRSEALVTGGVLPKSSFSAYTFPDAHDLDLAVLDTVTTDLVHTERKEVERYIDVHDRLRTAALSPSDSLAFLSRVADQLDDPAG